MNIQIKQHKQCLGRSTTALTNMDKKPDAIRRHQSYKQACVDQSTGGLRQPNKELHTLAPAMIEGVICIYHDKNGKYYSVIPGKAHGTV